ncbi:MAG: hypothetical protein ACOYJG_05195 [Prevotella sp.]|jgi:hypothetical protein
MKRIVLLLTAVLLVTGVNAQQVVSRSNSSQEMPKLEKKSLFSSRSPQIAKELHFTDGEVITEEPEGETFEDLARASFGIVPSGIGLGYKPQYNAVGNYTKGDDGNLYIYNPLTGCYTFSYMKLEPTTGDTLVLHTPQAIEEDYDGSTNYLLRLVLQRDSLGDVVYAPQFEGENLVGDVKFTFKDDVLTQVDEGLDEELNIPKVVMALVDDTAGWKGWATSYLSLKPFNEEATVVPEDLELHSYIFYWYESPTEKKSTMVQAAFTDDAVYMESPFEMGDEEEGTESKWMKGSIEGDKVVFKEQYMGISDEYNVHLFLLPAKSIVNEEDNSVFDIYKTDSIVLSYDAENSSMSVDSTQAIYIAEGKEAGYFYECYAGPRLEAFTTVDAVPASPKMIEVAPWNEDDEQGYVHFSLAPNGADGEYLLSDSLFYCIYVDDPQEPIVFSAELYSYLDEDMVEVPYLYTDEENIYYEGEERLVYLFQEEFDSVGVQAIYHGKESKLSSPIVWMVTTGIKDAQISSQPKSVVWYDLSGRRVTRPDNGLFIEVREWADGRKTVRKVCK